MTSLVTQSLYITFTANKIRKTSNIASYLRCCFARIKHKLNADFLIADDIKNLISKTKCAISSYSAR